MKKDKKKTILFLFHEADLAGGATYSGINLIQSLDRSKYEVLVLLPRSGSTNEVLKKIRVKTIFAPVDAWIRGKDEINLSFVTIAHRFCGLVKNLLKDCIIVKKALEDYQVDVIHSNSTAIIAGLVLAKLLHCKHVWHLREFIDLDFHTKPYLGFRLMKEMIKMSDATISITKIVRNHWIDNGVRNAFVAFDAVKSLKTLPTYIEAKEKYFLFCATVINRPKGAFDAMNAFCTSNVIRGGID